MAKVPRWTGIIKTEQIEDNAITSAKINDSAVTSAKINDSAVTSAKINNSAVDANKIASSAVTTAKIDTDFYNRVVPASSGQYSLPSNNSNATWAHGLGGVPSRYKVSLLCVSSEYGYGTGTEIDITSNLDGDGGRETTSAADSTNIYVRSNTWSGYFAARFDGVNAINLTPANWRILFRAWK